MKNSITWYIRDVNMPRKIYAGIIIFTLACIIFCSTGLCLEYNDKTQASLNYAVETEKADDFSFYKPLVDIEPYPEIRSSKVKNIIFCIGDGMGLGQVAAARIKAVGAGGKLYMEKITTIGLIRTHSADSLVTDSAASGTAMATGFKTNNGMIGMLPDGKKCLTILEAAGQKGLAVGLVVTSTITHATPACFAAHVEARSMQDKIAEHLLKNRVNVLFGGGRQFFLPQTDENSKRKDNRNLTQEAKTAGYDYIEDTQQLNSAQGAHVLGLFKLAHLTTDEPEPTLDQLTKKAIEILSKNKKGFFLMVEGSQIDWACHKNSPDESIKQTLLFDMAVKEAINFALKNRQTLVIVAADHETGGLAINDGELNGNNLQAGWTTKSHTALPIVLYAFGPGAQFFAGTYDNTEIPVKFARLLGIKSFPLTVD